jgi:serine/threonine-protein kinase mTOR
LIARIHSQNATVRRAIHQLLTDVGKAHPQALIYPLTVASKSKSAYRRRAALAVMEKMKAHSATLVEQALLVSQELVRVAVLWHEIWYEGIEEAARLYFVENDKDAMFAVFEPLHEALEKGPETLRETSFHQANFRELHEARNWGRKYQETGEVGDLNQAWDLYYKVMKTLRKQITNTMSLELQYVSPKLLEAHDLEIAVPGTYQPGKPIVTINTFVPTITVINSKRRPRKVTILGSDGRDHVYVLKGHEDIRQDERVMQLFGLVNKLLSTDAECFKRHLNIERYPVIPLSPNSALLGWVPGADTLNMLIREYRESRKILVNIEQRLMLQMAPDYENMTLMQKVEVFEYALDNTTGQDLWRVFWLRSKNSEVWLERRTNYMRTLAVMSMVGYILGLGDRHPSNLMLDRNTGKIVHIDFGDCFEIAMHREKYPETVPFRLTRMLMNAMEVYISISILILGIKNRRNLPNYV